jgi:hypothetical protein
VTQPFQKGWKKVAKGWERLRRPRVTQPFQRDPKVRERAIISGKAKQADKTMRQFHK